MKKLEKTVKLGDKELKLTTGELAQQAGAAVTAQVGETVVLATVVSSPMKEDRGYFPLSVDYQERLYAGGRIKGSRWVKRGGRPTDEEILAGRIIDRSIRPLFPENYKADVQVVVMVMSVDMENNPVDLAPIAVAAAIEASSIPWNGPVSVLRMGYTNGKYITNPTATEMKESDLDLVVSVVKDSVVMVEAGAKEVSEDVILGGIEMAVKESKSVFGLFAEFAKEVGNTKEVVEEKTFDKDLKLQVEKLIGSDIKDMVAKHGGTKGVWQAFDELKVRIAEEVEDEADTKQAIEIVEKSFKAHIREIMLSGSRIDGRKHTEIRKLSSKVGVLPRTHGTGLFTRGSTQALTVTTLGSPRETQLLESAEGEEEKRYIHHYSMPPFSTGETGRIGFTSRREVGHGALAERALMPVLPSKEEFPYTIHVMSECLSSNGSTSMASTCGSTLSLMDAGVPISSPVSGIAMGLIVQSAKKYAILSDIMGIEDFNGDMDFKVTGTTKGITAMQMDVKTLLITPKILKEALAQAKEGRAFILESMLKTIKSPRKEISPLAPRIISLQIDPEKIGELIGPGGKTIKGIIADTGADVNVEDSGLVSISGVDAAGVEQARLTIESMTKEVLAGEIYNGTVARMMSFGAFVEIAPGKDGLVHVSDMSEGFVKNPEDIVSIGDKIQVRVKEVDTMGRINLSLNLDPASDEKKEKRSFERAPKRDFNKGGERRSFDRGPRRDNNNRNRKPGFDKRDRGGSSGPHFPASRLVSTPSKDKRR